VAPSAFALQAWRTSKAELQTHPNGEEISGVSDGFLRFGIFSVYSVVSVVYSPAPQMETFYEQKLFFEKTHWI
jgi:hypothetical protein